MSEQLNELLSKALVWLEDGAMWVSNEVPLYVEELLKWYTAKSIAVLVIAVVLFVLMGVLTKMFWKFHKDSKEKYGYTYEDTWMIGVIFTPIILGGVALGLTIHHVFNIIQITVAPRVWLIEYVSHHVNNGG